MKSKKYYIIGAGGLAKEVSFLAEETLPETFDFGGFIDYKPENSQIICRGKKINVLDENAFLKEMSPGDNIQLYLGIGNPYKLKTVISKYEGYAFPNLISREFKGEMASISMGRGNILATGSMFTVDISIGSFNFFYMNATIAHDAIIGDFNMFSPGCNVSGNVRIGSGNLFGANSTILPAVEIGNNNTIGAASLANKDIGNDSTVVGIPAKTIK